MPTGMSARRRRLWTTGAVALLVVVLATGCSARFGQRGSAAPAFGAAGQEGAPSSTPSSALSIGPHNVAAIQQVAQWGKGRRTDIAHAARADLLAVASALGVYVYDASDLRETGLINTDVGIDRIALSPSGSLLASTKLPVDGVTVWNAADGRRLRAISDGGYRIDDLVFSPDEQHLAYVSATRTTDENGRSVIKRAAKLWHISTGALVAELMPELDSTMVASPAFSQDGRWLAALAVDDYSGTLLLWDSQAGAQAESIGPHAGDLLRAVAFSPDGATAAALASGVKERADSLYIWDTDGWTLAQRMELPDRGGLEHLRFSPDGSRIAAGGSADHPVHLWTVDEAGGGWQYQSLARVEEGPGRVHALAFSPDGTRVVAHAGQAVYAWDTQSGDLVWTADEEESSIAWLNFSQDGSRLLGALENGVLWAREADGGTVVHELDRHIDQGVTDLALARGGSTVIAGGSDGRIRFWDVDDGRTSGVLALADASVDAVSLSPDGAYVAAALAKSLGADVWDDRVQVWHWPDQTLEYELESPHGEDPVATCSVFRNDVAFSPRGDLIAAPSFDHLVSTWHMADGKLVDQKEGHDLVVVDVAYAPDGLRLASASTDGTVRIWRADGSRLERTLPDHFAGATSVAYSPDGSLLATSDATGQVFIWRAGNGKKVQTLEGQKNNSSNLEFSPDGALLAAGGANGGIEFWDAATWQHVYTLPAHRGRVNAVRFSDDGEMLATGSEDGTIRLWRP